MLLSEYLDEWLTDKCLTLERSTYEAYTVYIHRHMIPYFEQKKIELEKLKPTEVLGYCQHLQTNGRIDGKGGLGKFTHNAACGGKRFAEEFKGHLG